MNRLSILLFLLLISSVASAQVPGTLTYQGILTESNGDPVADGSRSVTFSFYDVAAGGSALLARTITINTENGFFNCIIGDGDALSTNAPLPIPALGAQQIWIGVTPQGGTELAPRIRLTSVPYAFRAAEVDGGAITAGTIANARLDANLQDLADGSLSGSKVGAGVNAANITVNSLAVANGGTGAVTATGARTNLGLTIGADVQAFDADLADLSDGTLAGTKVGTGIDAANITVNSVALANGGTGASTAIAARTNLGLAIGTDVQAFDTDLADLADGVLTGSKVGVGVDAANITVNSLSLANGGTGAGTAGGARTNLGLVIGTDVQAFDADLADLSDGSLTGSKIGAGINAANITVNSVAVANGGTGAGTAAAARTNLNLVPGTDIQAFDTDLTDLADGSLTGSKIGAGIDATNVTVNSIAVANGGTGATTALAARTNLGIVIGTDVQPFDADLADLADGTLTGSKIGTGIDAANVTVNSVAIANGGTGAATANDARINLGLTIGAEVQAFDADLSDLADGTLSGSKVGSGVNGANISYSGAINQVPYWNTSGVLSGSNSNLYWDNALSTLGVGGSVTNTDGVSVYTGAALSGGINIVNNYSGTGDKFGTRTTMLNGTGNKYAGYNSVNGNGGSQLFGQYNLMSHSGSGAVYGAVSSIGASTIFTSSPLYGFAANASNIGSGRTYLFYGSGTLAATAQAEYGVYLTDEEINYFSGNLGIGVAVPTYKLHVVGNTYLNGTPYSGQANFTVISDKRTKRDVNNFNDGLATVLKINPVRFKYNGLAGSTSDNDEKIGVIAQDIQKVAPYMVSTERRKLRSEDANETEMLVYNSSALPYILVNAIKEQQSEIDDLKARIEKLEKLLSGNNGTSAATSASSRGSRKK